MNKMFWGIFFHAWSFCAGAVAKRQAAISRCPSTVSRTVWKRNLSIFNEFLLGSLTEKKRKPTFARVQIEYGFDCFRVRFVQVMSTWRPAEYGFGEYGFKHRTQWVSLPSPSSRKRTPLSSSQPIICVTKRTHQVFRGYPRIFLAVPEKFEQKSLCSIFGTLNLHFGGDWGGGNYRKLSQNAVFLGNSMTMKFGNLANSIVGNFVVIWEAPTFRSLLNQDSVHTRVWRRK